MDTTVILDAIRAGLVADATADQRRAGALAARAVVAALDPSPPPVSAPAPPAPPSLDVGLLLDGLIAKLGALAETKHRQRAATPATDPPAPPPPPPPEFRIPFVPLPRRSS